MLATGQCLMKTELRTVWMPGFVLQYSWVRHSALILPDAWHGFASRQQGLMPLLAMGPINLQQQHVAKTSPISNHLFFCFVAV